MNCARRIVLAALLWSGAWVWNAQASPEQSQVVQEPEAAAQNGDRGTSESSGSLSTKESRRLQMNFRNVPLDVVLDYLSSSFGFIILKQADPKGNFDFQGKDALSKEQALNLVNSVIKKSGYGLISEGRILTVISLDSAKTADLEVGSGSDPDRISKSEDFITQVIPVRYANATQLVNNLQLLLAPGTSLSANESANSLVLVASKTVIRRMLRIVKALDTSMATASSIKVFPLRYSDAKQLASVVQQLFAAQSGSGALNNSAGFGPPGFAGPPQPMQGNEPTSRTSSTTKIVAAADETSNCLIVSASVDSLRAIIEMVQQIDRPVTAETEVRMFQLQHADPVEIADQLGQLFPDSSKNSSGQNQQAPIFGGPSGSGGGPAGFFGGAGGPPGFNQDNASMSTTTRTKVSGQVIAVADPRTSTLVVSASSLLLPQIAKVIQELDASSARREVVKVFDLQNADPQDVNQILQDLFNRNSSTRNNNNNNRSMLGQSNPLTTRETEQQTGGSSQGSGFGNSGGPGGGGAASGGGPR